LIVKGEKSIAGKRWAAFTTARAAFTLSKLQIHRLRASE
jgi:hypothetical protein